MLIPNLLLGQLYKPDSSFHNDNYTIWGSYKNGLKHGSWEYRSEIDSQKIVKYEEYWFGELVRTDTTNIYHYPMFNINDSIIEYVLSPTLKFVLGKLLIQNSLYYYHCNIRKANNGNTNLYLYQRKKIENDIIKHFCELTNRYIVIDSMKIPIILGIDYEYAHMGKTASGAYYRILIDKNKRILEIQEIKD